MTTIHKINSEDSLLYFTESLPDDCIRAVCTQGDNDQAIDEWVEEFDIKLSLKWARKHLSSLGVEATYKMDADTLKGYILWVAAWNKFDNEGENSQ
jgi:hypothetical protein